MIISDTVGCYIALALVIGFVLMIASYLFSQKDYHDTAKANIDEINQKLASDPNDEALYIERAREYANAGLTLSGIADLEKAFILGMDSQSLEGIFRMLFLQLPNRRAIPWPQAKAVAPMLCAKYKIDYPEGYNPAFLFNDKYQNVDLKVGYDSTKTEEQNQMIQDASTARDVKISFNPFR